MFRKINRRQFLSISTAGVAGSYLTGCATSSAGLNKAAAPTNSKVQLLFYADTNAQWLPNYVHPRANHLGPMSLLGQAPYLTEEVRLASLGLLSNQFANNQHTAKWLTAQAARENPMLMGGYAVLAAKLKQLRQEAGADASLTLEGGGCWTGSGLATISQGNFAPTSSNWLGADVKVASNEQQLLADSYQNLYKEFDRPVLGSASTGQQKNTAFFTKAGIKIAVIGCANPWQLYPQGFNEETLVSQLQEEINLAAKQASLILLLSDAGTNPSLWLAQRLVGVDVILASGGQDLWPQPLVTRVQGKPAIPVVLAGHNGQGLMQLELTALDSSNWQLNAHYHPLFSQVEAEDAEVSRHLQQLRAPYASWLDLPLAEAPSWLFTQDSLSSSWSQLAAVALHTTGASLTLAPGLRQGLALPPSAKITREHLLSLTAGHTARVFQLTTSKEQLQSSLEAGASQLLSDDWFLHTNEDMPRLSGANYILRYQGLQGARIGELNWSASATSQQVSLAGWSKNYTGRGIEMWQLMEDFLKQQKTSWQLPQLEEPSLAFVDGHPGWRPAALL